MNKYSLELKNLSKTYNRRVIFDNINLTYNANGIYGIAGANGSGKSTLVKIIAGLLNHSSGSVVHTLEGKTLQQDDILNHIGFASPYLNLYEEFSAIENIDMLTAIRGLEKNSEYEDYLFKTFLLSDRRKDVLRAYSSGMKQRLRLIFAFVHNPQLIILDEPISNLDNNGRDQIYSLIDENKDKKIILIASNEDADLALCNSVINIQDYKKK